MNRHNSTLLVIILLTAVLVSGFTANMPTTVFADSRFLGQSTKQTANCDTVGADSPVSDSCNQRAANNINNGVPKTSGAAAPITGTLTVNKVCVEPSNPGDCERTGTGQFEIRITRNNPSSPGFELRGGGSQDITLGSGSFTITETTTFPFTTFSGDCMLASSPGPFQVAATGTIAAGQHPTCTITNSAL